MLSNMLDKLGFRKARREVSFRVGDYVTPAQILASIPPNGTYSISLSLKDGRQEKHVLIDGKEWFMENYNPRGLASTVDQLMIGSFAQPFRIFKFPSADGYEMRVRRGGYCDDNFLPQENHSEYIGNSSLDYQDLDKDIKNYQELMELVPGIETEQPKGCIGRLLHYGRVRVSKIIAPACQAG